MKRKQKKQSVSKEADRLKQAIDVAKQISRYRVINIDSKPMCSSFLKKNRVTSELRLWPSGVLPREGITNVTSKKNLVLHHNNQSTLEMSIRNCFQSRTAYFNGRDVVIEKILNEELVERFIRKWWYFKKLVFKSTLSIDRRSSRDYMTVW